MKKYFTSLIVWGVIIVVFLTLGGGGLLALFLLLLLIYGIIELYKKVYMDIASLKLKKRNEKWNESFVFDDTPDQPVPFGLKTQWLAVKTQKGREVAEAIGLTNMKVANWETGMHGAINGGYYFVSPSVKGWTLVVSSSMDEISTNK